MTSKRHIEAMHESIITPPCKTTFPSHGRVHGNSGRVCKNIRIFKGCEVQIENSVTRVTVRQHKACRVMPNSYPSDEIFNSHRRTIMDSFSCIHFLRKLYINFDMRYSYIAINIKWLQLSDKIRGTSVLISLDIGTLT